MFTEKNKRLPNMSQQAIINSFDSYESELRRAMEASRASEMEERKRREVEERKQREMENDWVIAELLANSTPELTHEEIELKRAMEESLAAEEEERKRREVEEMEELDHVIAASMAPGTQELTGGDSDLELALAISASQEDFTVDTTREAELARFYEEDRKRMEMEEKERLRALEEDKKLMDELLEIEWGAPQRQPEVKMDPVEYAMVGANVNMGSQAVVNAPGQILNLLEAAKEQWRLAEKKAGNTTEIKIRGTTHEHRCFLIALINIRPDLFRVFGMNNAGDLLEHLNYFPDCVPAQGVFYDDLHIDAVAKALGLTIVVLQNEGVNRDGSWKSVVINCEIFNHGGSNGIIYLPYVDRLHFPNGAELNECLRWRAA